MGRAARKHSQAKKAEAPRRRSWRRRQRRLGRSYNPSPEALSEQTWYHGSGRKLRKEDITADGGMSWLLEGGFNIVSLSPVARMYGENKQERGERWCLHKVKVLVQNPLDRKELVRDNPKLWEAVRKEFLRAAEDLPEEITKVLAEGLRDGATNEDVLIWYLQNRRYAPNLRPMRQILLDEGWDSVVGPMDKDWKSSDNSYQPDPAFIHSEELLLLDPQKQIVELK